jgi:hypothetical protein
MEKNLNYYRAIQNSIGCSDKSDWIRENTIRRLEQDFENPVDVETFMFWNFGKEMQTPVRLEVVDEKYSDVNGDVLKATSLLSTPLKVGNILYRPDIDEYYLCKESYKKSRMFYKCALVRCNYWMKWQDKNAKIYEYPVFEINSTQYNSGESGDKTITLGSSQHLVTITADENTILLDHGQRVFWDRNAVNPTVFKITQNDTTAMNYDKGLLKITIAEDERNPNRDSIENWLCDYYEVSEVTILYDGQSTIRAGGTKTLMVDTDKTVVWSVEGDIAAEIIPDGNSAKIKCPNNHSYIDKEIIVKAVVEEAEDICKLTVTGGV